MLVALDGTDNKVAPRRQRDPRRLARGGQGRRRRERAAAVPLRRRRQRARAAGPDDERAERRRARRLATSTCRSSCSCRVGAVSFAGGAAVGRRDVPRAQGAAAGTRAQHRARRRRRLRARPPVERGGAASCCSKRSSTRATRPGDEIALALDVASTEFFADGVYTLAGEGRKFTAPEFGDYLADLCDRYPIVSIEDGMAEDDWDGWRALTERARRRACSSSATTCSSPTPSGSPRASSAASRTRCSSRSTRSAR